MPIMPRARGVWTFVFVSIAVCLSVACTTSFPLSLIDGGGQSDGQVVDASPDTGQPDVVVAGCGDGVIAGGEACDDGNLDPDDGCDAACQVETGWSCSGTPSSCVTSCGDGQVAGTEDCDDGNSVSGDGCNDACEVDCSNASTTDCNPAGETKNPSAAFVDLTPPTGFVQCAGFENTNDDDVGSNWDAGCLGTALTLRIRYWDTSLNPWVLLGDATLAPVSDASYIEQVFSATNHGGTEGFLATLGVSLLKDDPGVTPVTTWVCNAGHPNFEYGASDLYFGTETDNDSVMVCGWSVGDDPASPCKDDEEIAMAGAGFDACNNGTDTNSLAIAIYQQL